MTTDKEVAQWMVQQIEASSSRVYQHTIVWDIKRQFGDQFVYWNENSSLAISKDVLTVFRKLKKGKVVWNKSDSSWTKL